MKNLYKVTCYTPYCGTDTTYWVLADHEGDIPEEELMLLGIASRLGKLTLRAQERFVYLYERCFGQREEDEHE